MDRQYNVVGIGELLWDLLPQKKVLGGAPANFAFHANELGAKGYVISAIGKDKLGVEIESEFGSKNLELRLSKLDYPTGIVKVKLNVHGIPEYEIIENAAWDYIPLSQSDIQLAKETDAVCFGSLAQRNDISRKSITDFISNVPCTSLKIFDMNLRQHFYSKELILSSIEMSNILKLNDDELVSISNMLNWEGTTENLCTRLMETFFMDILALTCGTKGSYIFKGREKSFLPTPVVDVKDTVGAGDSFTAGMAMGFLNGKSILESHSMAVILSAYVCTQSGAVPHHPDHLFINQNI